MNLIGRFAPSPTGPLHLGSLLTALCSYLDAQSAHAKWLVRIEDLDKLRCRPEYDQSILKTLNRFSLRATDAPLRQSERIPLYNKIINQLKKTGLTFNCVCTRAEITDICIRNCRDQYCDPHKSSLRLDLTSLNSLSCEDRSLGTMVFDPLRHRDVIIQRRDSIISYHLAVVIDDAAQEITDVVRGADLLESTSWQLGLQQVLNYPQPTYLHLPVVTGTDGEKLSKSQNSIEISSSINASAQICSLLKGLGQNPPSTLYTRSLEAVLSWASDNWAPKKFKGQRTHNPITLVSYRAKTQ